MSAELVLPAEDIVGESIVWDSRLARLVWVDIVGKRLQRMAPDGSDHEIWEAPDFVTSVGLRADGGAVVGLTRDVALWDFGGDFRNLAMPEPDVPDNRMNDGVVGPDGAFWVGTMQNNLNPDGTPKDMTRSSGAIYRITSDGAVSRLTERNIGLTNTLAWTSDDHFISADTMANQIHIYDYDRAAGTISNPRRFDAPIDRGLPDGSCMDDEGCLWNCRVVGGCCLARYAPDGSIDRVVELPCSWPTSCTFGGDNLDTLFVTSARFTMSDAHLAANRLEGGLFCLKPGVRGVPANRFG